MRKQRLLLSAILLVCIHGNLLWAQNASTTASQSARKTGVLPSSEVEKMLPGTVYFQGRTAPLQIRNAGAVRFNNGSIVFASLVDAAGYASAIRDKYQLYLVAETRVRLADKELPAGAYGCGLLADGSLIVMDIGGHDLMSVPTNIDSGMKRARPLQVIAEKDSYRLYLGRRYLTFSSNAN